MSDDSSDSESSSEDKKKKKPEIKNLKKQAKKGSDSEMSDSDSDV